MSIGSGSPMGFSGRVRACLKKKRHQVESQLNQIARSRPFYFGSEIALKSRPDGHYYRLIFQTLFLTIVISWFVQKNLEIKVKKLTKPVELSVGRQAIFDRLIESQPNCLSLSSSQGYFCVWNFEVYFNDHNIEIDFKKLLDFCKKGLLFWNHYF